MTFQQLYYVIEIAKYGSINKTAEKLYLSQSSISSAIKELEKELGICILSRTNRGVQFTIEGKEFLKYASALMDQKQLIENTYKNKDGNHPKFLNISSQHYPFVTTAFIQFMEEMQDNEYHFDINMTDIDSVIEDVYSHHSEIGIIFLTKSTQQIIQRILHTKNIYFHNLETIQPCIFVNKHHPLTSFRSVCSSDLKGYPYLNFSHSHNALTALTEEIHLTSFETPSQVITLNDRAAAINIIAKTSALTTGTGLLNSSAVDEGIISIPLVDEEAIHLGWICLGNKENSQEAACFIKNLKKAIRDAIHHTHQIRNTL